MTVPSAFADLNGVLVRLVDGVRSTLGGSFVGAYLQGSFALAGADTHSDVDFVVATADELTDEQQSELQRLHGAIHDLPVAWAQHLEGSYIPRALLRSVDLSRTPCFYLDNGARSLVWSDHCNTAHVRWVLREHGVVLAGPRTQTVVDPVPPDALRSEALRLLDEYTVWAHESRARYDAGEGLETGTEVPFSRWQQPYLVLTVCRILWTLRHGTVTTKRRAGEWAMGEVGPEAAELVERALADRADPWERTRMPSAPELVERTCAFIEDVRSRAHLERR